jgi:hypothetical protein
VEGLKIRKRIRLNALLDVGIFGEDRLAISSSVYLISTRRSLYLLQHVLQIKRL